MDYLTSRLRACQLKPFLRSESVLRWLGTHQLDWSRSHWLYFQFHLVLFRTEIFVHLEIRQNDWREIQDTRTTVTHRKVSSNTFRSWISTSKDITASQIAGLSSIGVAVGVTAILSALNVSSFIIIWMVFNQMRILILMLLTEAYFPSQIKNYLLGLKLFSFNFSFLFIQDIPGINEVSNLFDFSQPETVLQDIGLISKSSLFNSITIFKIA